MKTLHKYILGQVLAALFMTVAVFTFVMMLGSMLKDVLDLLVNGYMSIGLFAEAIGLLIPWVWAFSLPMGMLTATLLVFGRFSADHELTAVRAGGVSLISLVSPVLLLSVVMCGLSALVNLEYAPKCRVAFNNLRFKVGAELSRAQLPEGRYIKDFPGYILYIGKNHQGALEDVRILKLEDGTNVSATIDATRGQCIIDEANQKLKLKLFDAQVVAWNKGDPELSSLDWETPPIDLSVRQKKVRDKPNVNDMSFSQLREELRDVESRFSPPPATNMNRAQVRELMTKIRKSRDDSTTPLRVQIHSKMASSFACFGFTLLGIPLGIRVHRRETNVGFFMALILVLVYYGLLLLGMGLDTRPELAPHLIVWLPNFLFQAVGIVLLWRANRGI